MWVAAREIMRFRGQIISISGVDGCGKTTIVDEVRRMLSRDGMPTRYVWLRYNHYLTKVLLAFCRVIGMTKYEEVNGLRVGYHNFHNSKLIAYLFVCLTYVDTVFATLFKVYAPAFFSRSTVICDRWALDIIVDLQVDTNIDFVHNRILRNAFLGLMPRDTKCFLIERNDKDVLAARPENAVDRTYPARCALYQAHAKSSRINRVDNNGRVASAVNQIVGTII